MNIIKLFDVKNSNIRNQMVSMFLIVMLPLFAVSVILLINMRIVVNEKSVNTSLGSADSIRFRLADIVGAVEPMVGEFVTDRAVVDFLYNDYSEKGEYYKYYSSSPHSFYLRSMPQIQSIKVFTERDDFVFNSDYIYADTYVKELRWYSEAVSNTGECIWDIVQNPDDGKFCLGCVRAITKNGNIAGVAAALISDEWVEKTFAESEGNVVLSVNDGRVFYSNYNPVSAGGQIEFGEGIPMSEFRGSLDYGFYGYKGNTIVECFFAGSMFQIILLIPSSLANMELNRLTVVYGGYFFLFIILSVLIIMLFTSVFSRRITTLSEKMHMVAGGNFNVDISDTGHDEIAALYTDLSQMINSMQTMMTDIYNAKLQNEEFKFVQMEAEFKALSSQINPHFLYNTLETIRMKAFCNNDKETADLVKKLGKFMRRCLEFKDGEVTLRSELEFTNGYLELQSARFGDRVSYSIYSEVSKDYMILPLIIQPVVENAFVHGIESCKNNGRIDVKVYYDGDKVIIDVRDNGIGMDKDKLRELETKLRVNDTSSGKSIGLTNVNKRIKMYHGDEYGMTVKTKKGAGTTIRITLPREPVKGIIRMSQSAEAETGKQA